MAKPSWYRGISEEMRSAVRFAEEHGFSVELTENSHLKFKGHGAVVIGSVSPRNHFAAKQAISRMKIALRAAESSSPS